jgi:regulator of sigma E protease
MPFVIGAVLTSLPIKIYNQRCCSYHNGQAAKYIDQAKAILENNKGKNISATVLRDQKKFKLR